MRACAKKLEARRDAGEPESVFRFLYLDAV